MVQRRLWEHRFKLLCSSIIVNKMIVHMPFKVSLREVDFWKCHVTHRTCPISGNRVSWTGWRWRALPCDSRYTFIHVTRKRIRRLGVKRYRSLADGAGGRHLKADWQTLQLNAGGGGDQLGFKTGERSCRRRVGRRPAGGRLDAVAGRRWRRPPDATVARRRRRQVRGKDGIDGGNGRCGRATISVAGPRRRRSDARSSNNVAVSTYNYFRFRFHWFSSCCSGDGDGRWRRHLCHVQRNRYN